MSYTIFQVEEIVSARAALHLIFEHADLKDLLAHLNAEHIEALRVVAVLAHCMIPFDLCGNGFANSATQK